MGRSRVVLIALAGALGALLIGGCAADDELPPVQTGPRPAPGETVATTPAGGRTRLAGFKEVTVTVTDAEGRTRTFCLLLADTPELQEQGLMYVTDPALGGYDGMVFSYAEDSVGGFWMRNTRLPLSIAWVRADGSTVSTTDMAPCPDSEPTCPVYPPGGGYRFAIEVPQGGLGALGISDRSRVALGPASCAPA